MSLLGFATLGLLNTEIASPRSGSKKADVLSDKTNNDLSKAFLADYAPELFGPQNRNALAGKENIGSNGAIVDGSLNLDQTGLYPSATNLITTTEVKAAQANLDASDTSTSLTTLNFDETRLENYVGVDLQRAAQATQTGNLGLANRYVQAASDAQRAISNIELAEQLHQQ